MAVILYTYSVTSIRAAKLNAKLHREADGGQLDMRRESLRRHGVLEQIRGTGGVELFRDAGAEREGRKGRGLSSGLGIGEAGGGGGGEKTGNGEEKRVRTEMKGDWRVIRGRGGR